MATHCTSMACPRCGVTRFVRAGRPTLCRDCCKVKEATGMWMEHAACRNPLYEPEWWWPVSNADPNTVRAVLVCRACPVRDLCLDFAIQHDENHGVWGALMPEERRRIRAAQRKAVS